MSKSISVIIVLYNSLLKQTVPLGIAELAHSVSQIIVCDNSTQMNILKLNKQLAAKSDKITYLDMDGNKGLAIAYNRALTVATGDFVCILDDDTSLPVDFFEKIEAHVLETHAGVLLSLVLAQDGMVMSPNQRIGLRYGPFKDAEHIVNDSKMSAINSGIVIASKIYNRYRYDERYFVDMIDHQFMLDMHRTHVNFEVMDDVVLHQDYSKISDDRKTALNRLRIYARDSRIFYSGSLSEKIFRVVQIAYRLTNILFRKK